MNILLEDIKAKYPCIKGWRNLIKSLNGHTKGEVSFKEILQSNGIDDAVWCLKVLPYRDQCLFRMDVAKSVLHIFKDKHPNDDRPYLAIQATKNWYDGLIDNKQLIDAAYAAYDAANACSDFNAYSAACSAYAAAYTAFATHSIIYNTCNAYSLDNKKEVKQKIEKLFIARFCN